MEGERQIEETVTRDIRYDLSRLPADAVAIGAAVRGYWEIENTLPWVLNVAFREDACRVRTGHAAETLAVLRHLALNLLRRETATKIGLKAKCLKAGWDEANVLKVLVA